MPSHIANRNLAMLGCLSCDGLGSEPNYLMETYYYNSRPERYVTATYNTDPQEGRQTVGPGTAIEAWVRDYGGVWHQVGLTRPTNEYEIFRFDILGEIYYTGNMDLPTTPWNHCWVRWIRTKEAGWQKPQDVLVTKYGSDGTWTHYAFRWESKEIHFWTWITR